MELEKEIMEKEGIDLRFFLLRFINSIWIIIVAALAGAAICAGGYMLVKQVNPSTKEYVAETKYYIDFAEDSTGIGYGYYNDYTWNDWMKSDAILLYTMQLLPKQISKETVEKSVTADIISDVRLLTITVTASDKETADSIAQATALSLAHFPEEIKEIDGIRVIREDAAKEIITGSLAKNLAIFGGIVGAVVSCFVLWLLNCMDVSVYLPKDVEKRFHVPVLGVFYRKGKETGDGKDNRQEFLKNTEYLLKDVKKIALVAMDDSDTQQCADIEEVLKEHTDAEISLYVFSGSDLPDFAKIRQADAVIGCFAYGGAKGNRAERWLSDLKKQECEITHAIIYNADSKLYHRYFFGKK